MAADKVSRRKFVKSVIGGAAVGTLAASTKPWSALAQSITDKQNMPTRPLGRTGRDVKIFSLGGQATLEESGTTEASLEIVNRAIDLGVNYIDTAAYYGRGLSEKYIGQVMKSRRREVFLASKTMERDYDDAMKDLEQSLKNLQTDHLDLWQLHNVRTQDDLDKIFAKDGTIKAFEKAKSEGMVRFLGITGHRDPFVLRKAIEQYPFASILMALNAADKHEASFIDNLLPVAVEKEMAIVGMKIPARGRIFRKGGLTRMEQAMTYVLTLPVSTIIVGISTVKELEENIRLAETFKPYDKKQMAEIEEMTKPYFADATWFKRKW